MAEEGYQLKSTGMSGENHSTDPAVETDTTTLMIQKLEHVLSLVGPAKEEVSHLQKQVAYQQICPLAASGDSNHQLEGSSATENVKHLQKELDNVKDEKAMLQQKINTELMKKESEYHQNVKELMGKCTEKVDAFKEVNYDLEIRLQTAQAEIKEKEKLRERIVSLFNSKAEEQKEENKRLSDSLKTARLERSALEKELSNTKSRLSKLMGDKLSDNNPDIADLSDNNRPTKLAEKYQELYDNEWTDAFEAAEKYFSDKSEKIRTKVLVQLLLDIYRYCQKEFEKQNRELAKALYRTNEVNSTLPVALKGQIKEIKRLTVKDGIHNLTETYLENVDRTKNHGKLANEVKYFVKECIALCWLMVHQDPPVAFHLNVQRGDQFDSNKYKHYTTTGVCIDFVVWPALLLYEAGPVLSKGVTQCIKVIEGSKSVRVRSREVRLSDMGIQTGSVRLTQKQTTSDTANCVRDIFNVGNNSGIAINSTDKTIPTTQSSDYSDMSTSEATKKDSANWDKERQDLKDQGEQQTRKITKPKEFEHRSNERHPNDYANSQLKQVPQSNESTQHFHSETSVHLAQNQPACTSYHQPQMQSYAINPSCELYQNQHRGSVDHSNANQLTANESFENQSSASLHWSKQSTQTFGTPSTQTSPVGSQAVNQEHSAPCYPQGNVCYPQTNAHTLHKTDGNYAYTYPQHYLPSEQNFQWFLRLYQQYGNPESVKRDMGSPLFELCMNYYIWWMQQYSNQQS